MAKARKQSSVDYDSIYSEMIDLIDPEERFLPSGSVILDAVLSNGKGVPCGTFIEISSDSGIGKSTICLHMARNLCAMGKRVLYVDTESGLNKSQIECFGLGDFVRRKLFIPARPQTFEQIEDIFLKVLEDPDLEFIFLDSITATMPARLLEKSVGDQEPGIHARVVSLFLQKFKAMFRNSGKTLIFVNQMRTKISFVRTSVEAAGGQAQKFYMDIRLQMRQVAKVERPMPGQDKPVPYASDLLIWATKNRYAAPFIPMPMTVIFGKGVSNAVTFINVLSKKGKISNAGAGFFKIEYQGEMKAIRGRPALEDFVRENSEYYRNMVEELGGVHLLDCEKTTEGDDSIIPESSEVVYEGLDSIPE